MPATSMAADRQFVVLVDSGLKELFTKEYGVKTSWEASIRALPCTLTKIGKMTLSYL